MTKQLELTDRINGGRVTKSQTIQRQANVERLLKMGYSLTRIASTMINDKKLGAIATISKDIDIIRSRWLEQDPQWFHRARIARVEAKERLLEQLTRMGDLIFKIKEGEFNSESNSDLPKKLTYAESQITTIISKIYEIDADFDPEQYLDEKIKESINLKIKTAKTEYS